MAVGWGVVGLGIHAVGRMLPVLRRSRRARLIGVYSRRQDVTHDIAARCGVRGYETFDDVLRDPEIQVVYLATPHDVHAEQTLRCAAAGKHVLVEKPMALSVEDAAAMVRACAGAGVQLYVGFHLRFHPAHRQARAVVASGQIGDLVWAEARWLSFRDPDTGWRLDPHRSGGTLLTARGVHLIDLIRYVCRAEFRTISGLSDGLRPEHPADDLTAAMGTLSSGGVAHLVCSRLVPGAVNSLEIYGTHGTIVCRDTLGAEPGGTLTVCIGSEERAVSYGVCDAFGGEVDWVCEAVMGGGRPDPAGAGGEDGARVTAVTCGLVASVGSGRAVTPEDTP
ncbi:MAG: Gfo/Idh/MocA family oxidoreductase [Bacillati bacterium ANGP1]|uniref:Gfo/Idh/MocA family oxidoreductase n=1 Tax=Candidatus Segetimicrobium genomatis TaxID=2569760 RepID=A0A537LXK8_9BACT|nr:MAG: Gfo/Idh/MocA family oxidoreductase [Terrabacteria group bacterium ANGP1]